jgi:4-hydroxy-tetrahydrodipicolinate reductase
LIAVSVHGADGRMGSLVTELIADAPDCRLAALITEPGGVAVGKAHASGLTIVGQDQLAAVHPRCGVIVDFSTAGAIEGLLQQSGPLDAPLVIGTTGYNAVQMQVLKRHAERVPVVHAPNFSIGIPALMLALRLLAKTLPQGFDAEQIETHHRAKIDRPSGTALWLADGWQSERRGEAVPIHAQRLGGIVGEHRWTLADPEETLELTHRAHSRRAFLRGVLPAVRFASGAAPGFYGLQDVLEELASAR